MGYNFNPFTGNLDLIDTTAAAGSDTQIQYNDNGSLAGSADLSWDDSGKVLDVGGDINLDDGGKSYFIDGSNVLSGTTLGSGVTASSLTSVGTLTAGTLGAGFTAVASAQGGTGQTTYANGELLIGKTDGTLAKATLTASTGVTITNGNGNIMISATGIANANIAANAEIAVSKLQDGTARQLLQTAANGTDVEWASNIDIPGTLDVTGAATFDAAVTIQDDLTVNGTVIGALIIGNPGNLIFEGSGDAGNMTILAVANPTAERTITFPDTTGTVVTTGDSGTVTSTMILDGTIVNADVNASAAIDGTKISPDFGSQTIATTGSIELGHATDTTLSRSAAGVLAVEGVVVPTVSSTNTFTNKTLTDPAIIGTILEDVFTITDGAAFEVDPGNGSIQLITLGANRTPKATNFAAGESITLMVDDGTAYTLTWTDATWGTGGVIWVGGSAPTLATSGYTVIQFWKVSTQVYGALVGEVA